MFHEIWNGCNLNRGVLGIVLFSLILLPLTGFCLRCIKCTSLRDPKCLDGIGEVQLCNQTQKYCVSYTGHLRKGLAQLLFRACSSTNMSDFCSFHYEKMAHNRVEKLLACYKTCNTDLCNTHRMDYNGYAATATFHTMRNSVLFGVLTRVITYMFWD